MKETGIIMSGDHPKLILEGKKTMTRRVVTPKTSEVGEGRVNWDKFCWDGSTDYREHAMPGFYPAYIDHKAPLPFVDGKPEEGQYLHVPYDWANDMSAFRVYPRWGIGDRLWVKETWRIGGWEDDLGGFWVGYKDGKTSECLCVTSEITDKYWLPNNIWPEVKWRPSIFMPKWASRILLEITGIKVERLQEITAEDCKAEGVSSEPYEHYQVERVPAFWIHRFEELWDSLNAKRGYSWSSNPWVWCISFKVVEK